MFYRGAGAGLLRWCALLDFDLGFLTSLLVHFARPGHTGLAPD
jgi:hypothetical protein